MTLDTLTLPDGLTWLDPWDIPAVSSDVRRRLDGGLAIYQRSIQGGRPITLSAPADQPLTQAQADALAVLAATPGAVYVLSMPLRSLSFNVMFRHHEAPALELAALFDYADPDPSDPVVGTIKLMEV